MEEKERILCAAIWYADFPKSVFSPNNVGTGVVLCGYRHADIIHQHVCLMGKRAAEMGSYKQGFLTNQNRFVDREEAQVIALAADQVKDLTQLRGKDLYSEDLY